MTAIVFGLLTALLFGIANYLGPVLSREHGPSAVLVVGQAAAVAAAVVLVLARGAAPPDARFLVLGLLAGVANGLALTAMFETGRLLPISVMAPIGATGGVVPVAVALVLGERPQALQLAGIPLALLGVALVAGGTGRRGTPGSPPRVRPLGLVLAALWALGYGTFLSLFAESSAGDQSWAVLTSRVSLLGTAVVVPALRRKSPRLPRRVVPVASINGLLILGGVVAFGLATGAGLVSVVSVLATLSPVVTVAMAVVLLRERLARAQLLGLVAAVAGIVLLAAG